MQLITEWFQQWNKVGLLMGWTFARCCRHYCAPWSRMCTCPRSFWYRALQDEGVYVTVLWDAATWVSEEVWINQLEENKHTSQINSGLIGALICFYSLLGMIGREFVLPLHMKLLCELFSSKLPSKLRGREDLKCSVRRWIRTGRGHLIASMLRWQWLWRVILCICSVLVYTQHSTKEDFKCM